MEIRKFKDAALLFIDCLPTFVDNPLITFKELILENLFDFMSLLFPKIFLTNLTFY